MLPARLHQGQSWLGQQGKNAAGQEIALRQEGLIRTAQPTQKERSGAATWSRRLHWAWLAPVVAAIIVLGVFGLLRAFFERSSLRWFAIPIFYTTLVYLPFHNTEARYSQPVLVFMTMFAAVELQHLFGHKGGVDEEVLCSH